MKEKITDRASGRWKSILSALGIPSSLLNGKHHPCPICRQGKDRFRFADYRGTGWYICSQCGGGSGFDLLMRVKGWDFRRAAEEVEAIIGACPVDKRRPERSEADKRKAMNDLWRSSTEVAVADPVGIYLSKRCGISEFPDDIRYARSIPYTGLAETFPAMLAKLTAPDGSPNNIHRTYLTISGEKAPVEATRRMMPGSIAKGAAVRLTPISVCMGIAEGIETAISATKLFGIPTWAALNAEMLKAWQPPEGVLKVTVFGDHDENFTGQAAAYVLARRLSVGGIATEIAIPEEPGTDWNDVLKRQGIAA